MWLFILLLAWPLVEIGLFVTVGGAIGLWPTLGIVLGTGVLGAWLLRGMGMRAARDLRARVGRVGNPAVPLARDAIRIIAALLLILPGFLTDLAGAVLLLPFVQTMVIAAAAQRLAGAVRMQRSPGPSPHRSAGPVIDAEYIEIETPDPTRPPSGWTRH